MKHLVITIGCEYGAKGNAIGKKIAQDLGIKFYDRDLVDEIIKEVGIPTDIMDRVEEGGTIAGKGAQGDVSELLLMFSETDRLAVSAFILSILRCLQCLWRISQGLEVRLQTGFLD